MNLFRTTEQADEDLIAVYTQGIERFGKRQADLYFDRLYSTFQRLADHPTLTRLRTEFDPPARAFTFGSHVILYDEEPEWIVIIRVRHAHENWYEDPRGLDNEAGRP